MWNEGVIHKLKCNRITSTLLTFFDSYLKDRHQHVVLNATESKWMKVNAGVPQGSFLSPLLFLVYINDLPDNIKSEMRLYADDSFLFTKVEGIEHTQEKIEEDLVAIGRWAYQWKMVFNLDITKQAVEIIFSVKNKITVHPKLIFNDVPVAREESTKHLGIHLDTRLNFSKHVREAILKATKGISIVKMLSKYVDRNILIYRTNLSVPISIMVMLFITIKELI